jgi:hypothetical protein
MPTWRMHHLGLRNPAAVMWSAQARSGSKNPPAFSTATGLRWMPSWPQVRISNSSSQVPNPPGRATKASALSAISAFRSCMVPTTISSVASP